MKFQDAPKFADTDEPTLADYKHGTVSWVIQRMIEDIASQPSTMKPLGLTHMYGLRASQRMPFGAHKAAAIKRQDWIELAKWRRQTVGAATAMQTISMIAGAFKYALASFDDCEDLAAPLLALQAAKPFLVKHNLISKSTPRTRRPSNEEHQMLLDYFRSKRLRKLDMALIADWQRKSSRRISETCRAEWGQWDKEAQTLLVMNMKDPRKKKNKVVALPDEAQAILIELEKHRKAPNNPHERIFPYNPRSCSAAYYEAKKALGIKNLRLHDSRRDCGTRLVEEKGYTSNEAILFTGHDSTKEFERSYLAMRPELMKLGPIAKRKAQEAQ